MICNPTSRLNLCQGSRLTVDPQKKYISRCLSPHSGLPHSALFNITALPKRRLLKTAYGSIGDAFRYLAAVSDSLSLCNFRLQGSFGLAGAVGAISQEIALTWGFCYAAAVRRIFKELDWQGCWHLGVLQAYATGGDHAAYICVHARRRVSRIMSHEILCQS